MLFLRGGSESQSSVFGHQTAAFPDWQEVFEQLSRPGAAIDRPFAVEAAAECAEVIAAVVVDHIGGGVAAIDGVDGFAKREDARQTLGQRDQCGMFALREGRILQQDPDFHALTPGGEAAQGVEHFGAIEQARIEIPAVDRKLASRRGRQGDDQRRSRIPGIDRGRAAEAAAHGLVLDSGFHVALAAGHETVASVETTVIDRFITLPEGGTIRLNPLGEVVSDTSVRQAVQRRQLVMLAYPGSDAAQGMSAIAMRLATLHPPAGRLPMPAGTLVTLLPVPEPVATQDASARHTPCRRA